MLTLFNIVMTCLVGQTLSTTSFTSSLLFSKVQSRTELQDDFSNVFFPSAILSMNPLPNESRLQNSFSAQLTLRLGDANPWPLGSPWKCLDSRLSGVSVSASSSTQPAIVYPVAGINNFKIQSDLSSSFASLQLNDTLTLSLPSIAVLAPPNTANLTLQAQLTLVWRSHLSEINDIMSIDYNATRCLQWFNACSVVTNSDAHTLICGSGNSTTLNAENATPTTISNGGVQQTVMLSTTASFLTPMSTNEIPALQLRVRSATFAIAVCPVGMESVGIFCRLCVDNYIAVAVVDVLVSSSSCSNGTPCDELAPLRTRSSVCQACNGVTVANKNHSACVCPRGFMQLDSSTPGSYALLESSSGLQCLPCTEGFRCEVSDISSRNASLYPGYWRSNEATLTAHQCMMHEEVVKEFA